MLGDGELGGSGGGGGGGACDLGALGVWVEGVVRVERGLWREGGSKPKEIFFSFPKHA